MQKFDKVSANVDTATFRLIKECGFQIRPLIERGLEASIPKGMDINQYIISKKEQSVKRSKIKMDQKETEFEKAREQYLIELRGLDILKREKLDFLSDQEKNLTWMKNNADKIKEIVPIKQESWEGDHDIMGKLKREFDRDISFDFLFNHYDEIISKRGE